MKKFYVLLAALLSTALSFGQAKYVFYFIGDGFGINELIVTEMYQAQLQDRIGVEPLCLNLFPFCGYATNYSASNSITDSSAAGTALAAGYKTTNGFLGQDPHGQHHATIAETLRDHGFAIGITTSVSIDHATPGAFYADVKGRNDYYQIGLQLAASDFDFFGGSTFYKPYDKHDASAPNLYHFCESKGYKFFRGYKEFEQEGHNANKAILIQRHEGLDIEAAGDGHIPYAIDNVDGALTLPQITESAISFLESKHKPFFLMVEGGQIDWACHGNDVATVIGEVVEFDKAIQYAFDFYKEHQDETLIVVTADHETGGLALGNSDYTLHLDVLKYQTASANVISDQLKSLHANYGKQLTFEQVKQLFNKYLGLYNHVEVTPEEDAMFRQLFDKMKKNKVADSKNMYASLNALSDAAVKLLNKKAHVGWTTHSHSAAPVPVFAIGVGAETFSGLYDQTEIMQRILKTAGIQDK